VALVLLYLWGASVNFKGENPMNTWRDYIAGAMFAWFLSNGLNVEAAVNEHRRCDYACQQFQHAKSELQRDEKNLDSDVTLLRQSLRHHGSQEQIERLRHQVQQDWDQIVLDRGHSKPGQEDQTPNLANRHIDQKAQSHRRS
jgi:hypothetical protein